MNKIAKYTRLQPDERLKHIHSIIKKLRKASKNQWGITIDGEAPMVEAVEIPPPRIRIAKNQEPKIENGTFKI